ncbi:MAG: ribosome recycling factor [Thermodesulfobacteriota bacterium]
MKDAVFKTMREKMEKSVSNLHHEFGTLRTGRASLSLLDKVMVDYYGNMTPISQVATLSVPDSRLILIQPWDATLLQAIEKAIMASELGITPTNDGKVIRIAIPPLTEERRRELVKIAKRMTEETRVAIRNARRDANDELKKLEKGKEISEDEAKKAHTQVQETTDKYIAEVDKVLHHKEEDIMEV